MTTAGIHLSNTRSVFKNAGPLLTTLQGVALAKARVQLSQFISGDTEKLDGVLERLLNFGKTVR
jgi:hypothetical protein